MLRGFSDELYIDITLHPGEGTVESDTIRRKVNSEFENPQITPPDGYVFEGWYKDAEFAVKAEVGEKIDISFRNLYARIIERQIIPPGYTLVEYLQKSTISQSIDTGLLIPDKPQIVMKASYPSGVSGESWLCGSWTRSGTRRAFLIGQYNNNIRQVCGADNSTYQYDQPFDKISHILGITKNRFVFDNQKTKKRPDFNTIPPGNLHIFKSTHTDNADVRRIYWCQIKDWNDTLVRDYIPCIDDNGVPCMYDLVNESTSYASTGTFTAGPVIQVIPERYWN